MSWQFISLITMKVDWLSKFISKLLNREHTITSLTPILRQAVATLDNRPIKKYVDTTSKTLYIHWTYYPKGLQWKDICNIYDKTLQPWVDHDHMQMAPKNLKDTLTRTALPLQGGININKIMQCCTNSDKQKPHQESE